MMASSSSPRNLGWPGVAEFYAHKEVFITGATGFMGKCLVEKLLRSVPELGRLFILVRPKRGKPVKDRIDDMLRGKVLILILSRKTNLVHIRMLLLCIYTALYYLQRGLGLCAMYAGELHYTVILWLE